MRSTTSLLLGALSFGWRPALADPNCLPGDGEGHEIQPRVIVNLVPLHLSTSLSSNTTFTVANTPVTVTNAPVVLVSDFLATTTLTYEAEA